MPISYSERRTITCSSCGQPYEADVWMLVDATERPDLAQAVRDGSIDTLTCPHCGHSRAADASLLFHDGVNRAVFFAIPLGAEEHEWRPEAQELLARLAAELPNEAHLPYLNNVSVEVGVEGVRRSIQRRQRLRKTAEHAIATNAPTVAPVPIVQTIPPLPEPRPAAPAPALPLTEGIEALLAADSDEELYAIVRDRPSLLEMRVDEQIAQLMNDAYDQGQRDIAAALQTLRARLMHLRRTGVTPSAADVGTPADTPKLAEAAYQALMRVTSTEELEEATRQYPALLEPWADDALAKYEEAALDEGNERLANQIEDRRDILAELRAHLMEEPMIQQAVEALLTAKGEEALAQALTEHPILLTEAIQEALLRNASAAKLQDDAERVLLVEERRAMLRTVRAGLEE